MTCVTVQLVSAFDELHTVPPQLLTEGYLARAIHGEHLSVAVVEVSPGAHLPEHHHVNEQFGMVIEGALALRVGDEERTVTPGGTWRIPSDTPHSAVAGDHGAVVIDVFSPPRTDWNALEPLEPRTPRWP
jgi:quercetin dioxygenase-like cupin family protein